jgi:tape measure domain-containing protein
MADQTQLIISIETILRGLDKTLRGLDQVEKQLRSVANIKIGGQASFDKAAAAAQKLQNAQGKLAAQTQELANRQEAARQRAERLSQSQDRLVASAQRLERASSAAGRAVSRQSDAQVRDFQRQQKAFGDFDRHVQDFRAGQAAAAAATSAFASHLASTGNALRSIGQGATQLGLVLSATLTAPLVAIGAASLNAAVSLDSLKRGLTAIVGSGDEAAKQLARLQEVAKLPGIGFEEAIQGSIRLQAVGFSAAEAEKALVQFANAIALTGGGRAELERVTVQLGQLAAKGKVLSQDLRPIIEAAPAVGKALLQAFGTVNAEDIQALNLSSKEFLDTLTRQLAQLPRAAAGAKNAFENFRDTMFRAGAAIGDALIPPLAKLADIIGPVITKLAEGFASLPHPLQAAVIAFAALLAAAGPFVFIVGQLTTGIGRLIVGLTQLVAAGLVPTIRSFIGLGVAAEGAAVEVTAAAVAIKAALVTSLVGLVAVIAGTVAALVLLSDTQEEQNKLDEQAFKLRNERIATLQDEIKFLSSIADKTSRNAEEEARWQRTTKDLNSDLQIRLGLLDGEKAKIDEVIKSKREQLELDQFVAKGIVNQAIRSIVALLDEQRTSQEKLTEAKRDGANAELQANAAALRSRGGAETAEERRRQAQELTNAALDRGVQAQKDFNAAQIEAGRQATVLAGVEGKTTQELIDQFRAAGADENALRALQASVDAFAKSQRDGVRDVDALTNAIRIQDKELSRAITVAEKTDQAERAIISGPVLLAKRTQGTVAEAIKKIKEFMAAQPELSLAIRNQAFAARKSVDDFLAELVGGKANTTKSETGLRNAQQALAESLLGIAQAEKDKEVEIQQEKNDQLLHNAETAQHLQLLSYREFLEFRANLADENAREEIARQQQALVNAQKAQVRLTAAAAQKGIPEAERVRRQAQANQAQEDLIRAETRLSLLELHRTAIADDLRNALKEASDQQLDDIRQLEVETGKLQDSLAAALDTELLLRFDKQLNELGKSQEFLNNAEKVAAAQHDADRLKEIADAKAQNQREIDLINKRIQQGEAVNALAVAEDKVTQAKERQSELEQQIANDVNFRGETEDNAIKRRLAGEEQVRQVILQQRDAVQAAIDKIEESGKVAPRALAEFVRQMGLASQSLNNLSFGERFDIVERQFEAIDRQREDSIHRIETAVRRRDISEIEGLIAIRQANGQYVGDLQKQLDILKDIAEQSNDPKLIDRARQLQVGVDAANESLQDFSKTLRSTSIDALQQGFTDFFVSLFDNTKTAKEKLLDFVNSVASSVERVIGQKLSEELIKSLFPSASQTGGIIEKVKSFLGFGGGGGKGGAAAAVADVAGSAGKAAEAAAPITAAATALSAAGATTAAAITTGGATFAGTTATAGATLAASIATAGASFAATVATAGAAFAAAVAAAGASSAVSSTLGGLGGAGSGSGIGSFAAGGAFSPKPAGQIIRVAEAGHAETVLTTDPKHAMRQAGLLRDFLRQTRGLGGRIPSFEAGGLISPRQAESSVLATISRGSSFNPSSQQLQLQSASGGGDLRLRQVFVDDQRQLANWVTSPEGETVLVEHLIRHAPLIRRLSGGRR